MFIWLNSTAFTPKKSRIIFHHDNARPHLERRVVECSANKGWELLPHPTYSLKNWQANKVYDDFNNLVADVKAWIASKNRRFFARGIGRLPSKWEADNNLIIMNQTNNNNSSVSLISVLSFITVEQNLN
ncbi:hypothetical protein CDAR_614001 [Caerostris darwini]|uniref:Transposase n=1 Tax=Caerostris darwini TaxID=1538125 RepID=A0AAV4M534_9ARAC|nr:hypothetical protein CDAR_614001 [Caerostris darwini]